jgi:transcriptional regulator with XRE-family HTH domain
MPVDARHALFVDDTPEKTLAENLRGLMTSSEGRYDSQAKVAAKAGIDQKTVGRMLLSSNSPTLAAVQAVARVFGVEAWQMLAPDLGAGLYKIDGDMQIVPVRPPKLARAKPTAVATARKRSGNGA